MNAKNSTLTHSNDGQFNKAIKNPSYPWLRGWPVKVHSTGRNEGEDLARSSKGQILARVLHDEGTLSLEIFVVDRQHRQDVTWRNRGSTTRFIDLYDQIVD
ncbi:hypothetical protein GCM10023217_33740 [Gordonia alkaliphila]|uniref:Transposase n=1 Tax=Gordonia alkaliphila TaxID=1053547 RepID=A0ABP8ZJV0_9ACTN